jgi:hypothetical protein
MRNPTPIELHARRLVRILTRTANELRKLNSQAQRLEHWPHTTDKAYIEVLRVLHNAQIRIAAKNSNAV